MEITAKAMNVRYRRIRNIVEVYTNASMRAPDDQGSSRVSWRWWKKTSGTIVFVMIAQVMKIENDKQYQKVRRIKEE